jgi:hypothetical protein
MKLSPTQAQSLRGFVAKWLQKLVPGLIGVRFVLPCGTVFAKDALGWRKVGTLHDFAAIARALGRLK